MYRMWMIFDPRQVMMALAAFNIVLALLIHFILLSSSTYNWIDGPYSEQVMQNESAHMSALPPQRG